MRQVRFRVRRLGALVALTGALGAVLLVPSAVQAAPVRNGAAAAGSQTAFAAMASSSPVTKGQPKEAKRTQTVGIGPARAAGLDRRPAFVYVGAPGTVIKDRFALLNYTTTPVTVNVYPSDAFTSKTGSFDVLPAGAKSKDVGTWATFPPRRVTIPARSTSLTGKPGQVIVPFVLKVPKGAAPGDHAGGIVASLTTRPTSGATSSVIVDRRVGTRIYVRVPGALEPRLEIKDLRAAYTQNLVPAGRGGVRATYRVENTGNVALSASQTARVDGLLGFSAASAPLADIVQLLPGSSVEVSTVIDGVWPTVRGQAVVVLEPYGGTLDAKQSFPSVTAAQGLWLMPWTALVLIVVILGAIWLYRRWRRPGSGVPDVVEFDPEPSELVTSP